VCGERRIDLRDFEKLRVVAIGKAAHAMVEGLALVLAPFRASYGSGIRAHGGEKTIDGNEVLRGRASGAERRELGGGGGDSSAAEEV